MDLLFLHVNLYVQIASSDQLEEDRGSFKALDFEARKREFFRMSTTAVVDPNKATLPVEVSEAAGLKPGDRIEWRYVDGEIRGRKLETASSKRIVGRLVRKGDALVLEADGVEIDSEAIADAVREERDRH